MAGFDHTPVCPKLCRSWT